MGSEMCIRDRGKAPEKQFSQNYQSGPLSFELDYLGEKLICNSGYFQKIIFLSHQMQEQYALLLTQMES